MSRGCVRHGRGWVAHVEDAAGRPSAHGLTEVLPITTAIASTRGSFSNRHLLRDLRRILLITIPFLTAAEPYGSAAASSRPASRKTSDYRDGNALPRPQSWGHLQAAALGARYVAQTGEPPRRPSGPFGFALQTALAGP